MGTRALPTPPSSPMPVFRSKLLIVTKHGSNYMPIKYSQPHTVFDFTSGEPFCSGVKPNRHPPNYTPDLPCWERKKWTNSICAILDRDKCFKFGGEMYSQYT